MRFLCIVLTAVMGVTQLVAQDKAKIRAERLKRLEKSVPVIAFVKRHPVRPSFYAYTEGQSDAQRERHFYPGSKLCLLKIKDGKCAKEFRCPFHGWAWHLDGKLKEVPCQWDFPTVSAATHSLPEVRLGHWGGFIFLNPDPDAEPLEDFLGNLSDQFPNLPYERRYKVAHVAKVLRCNWKVAQEAFSEAYHVIATHPTILGSIGDANTQYDVFG